MARGVTHRNITLVLAGACLGTIALAGPAVSLPLAAGCLTGIWVEPDLDVDNLTRSRYSLINSRPPVSWFGWMWAAYWWPYGKAIKHRSPLSHWPIIGTFFRLLYLSIPLFVAIVVSGGAVAALLSPLIPFLPLFFAGLVLSDLAHFIADL